MSTAITRDLIYYAASCDPKRLEQYDHQLTVEKMKLDKFFTLFLDSARLDEDNTETTEWKLYKDMLSSYDKVQNLLRMTKYYLKYGQ